MAATKTKGNKNSATPITSPETTEVLTLNEAAAYLRIEEAEVLAAVHTQQLPARQFGTQWRFFKPALQDWMKTPPRRKKGIVAHIGAFAGDTDLEEMLEEIHKRRDRPEAKEN